MENDKQLIAQYKQIHESKEWGTSGDCFLPSLQVIIAELRPKSILNYGCGQTTLHNALQLFDAIYYRYDPAIPEISKLPLAEADFLINTDVLEHIPEEQLPEFIKKMASISSKAFINIAMRPAKEILPNGQNAHCTIKNADEWKKILSNYYPNIEAVQVKSEHSVLFITWDSPLKKAISQLLEIHYMERKIEKLNRTLGYKIKKEFKRFRKRFNKSS